MLLCMLERADGASDICEVRLVLGSVTEIFAHRLIQRVTMRDEEVDRAVEPVDPLFQGGGAIAKMGCLLFCEDRAELACAAF